MSTIKNETFVSLFDIEEGLILYDKNKEDRWIKFESFILEFKDNCSKQLNIQVKEYWENYEKLNNQEYENNHVFLPWITNDNFAIIEEDKSLTKILKGLNKNKKTLIINDFSKFNILDKELPNFKEVTSFYRGSFAINQSRSLENYQSPKPILLLGNPGIGKTYYAKKLASILGTTTKFIDANGISANWVLSGHSKGWTNGDCGIIFKEVVKCPTISPILLIDEIDKLSLGKNYDPHSTFHQMFEKENSINFYDEFAEVTFNASQIIYILTANDKKSISPSLLSRMNVFEIKNPSPEEMVLIVQKIYINILNGSKLFKEKLEYKEVAKLIFKSPREVAQIIENNLFSQASKILEKRKKTNYSLVIKDLIEKEVKLGF